MDREELREHLRKRAHMSIDFALWRFSENIQVSDRSVKSLEKLMDGIEDQIADILQDN